MKFGKRLEEEVFRDWWFYALNYRALKNKIKTSVPFTEQDETEFISMLDRELNKVSCQLLIIGNLLCIRTIVTISSIF